MGRVHRYYYQQGHCTALHYNSLNPVLYSAPEEKQDVVKQRMVCNAIADGRCKNADSCQLLKDAPERLPYSSYVLRDNKLG